MNSDEIRALTLIDVADALREGRLTSVEVTRAAIDHAEATADALKTFVTFMPEAALERAADADAARARGEIWGPLHGVPVAFKDNLDTAGIPTECASPVLKGRVPPENAHVVDQVLNAGAVSLGKLNMHEFASGGTSINHYTGSPRNPWAPDHITGGSSGGSSTAVVAGIAYATLGTDAGGSVRIPAALCGHVGLKQTHGLVSNRGSVFNTWSGDHVGPHTKTVADAELMLKVMAHHDPLDSTSVEHALGSMPLMPDLAGVRVGVPETFFFDDIDTEVEAAVRETIAKMKAAGATIVPFTLATMDIMMAARMLTGSDGYLYHAKLLEERGDLYADQNLRYRLLASQYLRGEDYARAIRARRLVVSEFVSLFDSIDVIAAPTTPTAAYPIAATEITVAAKSIDLTQPTSTGLLARNTSPANYTGHPSVSIPVGRNAKGLPIGFMLTGAHFDDMRLLGIARVVEQLVDYREVAPWFAAATPALAAS
jgi:aspartyl-tRNA(Asn)/glutamyl-tRNA(Gln) amidotransferase subunit A